MQLITFALTFVAACAYAETSELGYSYSQPAPAVAPVAPQKSYLPPPQHNTYLPPTPPASVIQSHNDYIPPRPAAVSIQSHHTYIPPAAPAPVVDENFQNAYIPPAVEPYIAGLAKDGYRYKTVRRVAYKHRA